MKKLWTPHASADTQLRVLILGGASHIASAAHIPHLLENPAVELVGLHDLERERVEAVRSRLVRDLDDARGRALLERCALFGADEARRRATPLDELTEELLTEALDTSGADAVVICTPNHLHHPMAKAALLAGKHVLCEKPLATNGDLAAELRDLAEERGLVLMCGFHLPWALAGGQGRIIRARLGRVTYAEARWVGRYRHPISATYAKTGALIDIGLHPASAFFELVEWTAPTAVRAVFGYEHGDPRANQFGPYDPEQFTGETSARVTLVFPDMEAVINASYLTGTTNTEDVALFADGLAGSRAEIPFPTLLTAHPHGNQPWVVYQDGGVRVRAILDSPRGSEESDYRGAQSRHFVHRSLGLSPDVCCPEWERPVDVGGSEATLLNQVADAAHRSAARGGEFVPITERR